jgi:hypothetical protein
VDDDAADFSCFQHALQMRHDPSEGRQGTKRCLLGSNIVAGDPE